MSVDVETAFLSAHHAESRALGNRELTGHEDTKGLADVLNTRKSPALTAVLDRLPVELTALGDRQLIDLIDAAMDRLYRNKLLALPGHRWLAESPVSIRGHLVDFFDRGCLARDPTTGRWRTKELDYNFSILEPRLKAAVDKLLTAP